MKPGRPLDAVAVAAMVILCASWGLNQVAIKFALADIPPFIQGALRSLGALPVVMVARIPAVLIAATGAVMRLAEGKAEAVHRFPTARQGFRDLKMLRDRMAVCGWRLQAAALSTSTKNEPMCFQNWTACPATTFTICLRIVKATFGSQRSMGSIAFTSFP